MKKLLVALLFIASAAYGEIYTWKDARGTVFYTNSLHEIPSRYLSRAKVLDVATGKKSRLSTAQPGGQPGPGATPVPQPSAQQTPVQQTPVQQTPAAPPAPASPADASPAPPPPPPAATAAQQQLQTTRAQRRARARQNRPQSEEE